MTQGTATASTALLLAASLAFAAPASAFEFDPYVTLETDGYPASVAAGDVNGDGRDDLVTTVSRDQGFYFTLVHLQEPGGALAPPLEYPVGGVAVALEDFNQDGIRDILLAPPFFEPVSILLADGNGGFEHVLTQADPIGDCLDFAVLDIDLDGAVDIACHSSSNGSAFIYYGDGAGGIRNTAELDTIRTFRSGGFDLADIEAADVTGDGIEDLVIATYHSPGIHVFAHDGVGGFEAAQTYLDPGYTNLSLTGMPFALEIGDFNGDELNDVVLTKHYPPSHLSVFLQDPAGGMLDPVRIAGPDWMGSLVAADLDDDGSTDVVAANPQGVTRFMQSGGQLLEGIDSPAPVTDAYTGSVAAGDINGDGCVDAMATGAQLVLLFGSCGSPASDFNGDGRSDVLWRNQETGASALWNGAEHSEQLPIKGVANLAWQAAGVGDMDGDGRADLVWREATTGQNVIWFAGQRADQHAIPRVRDTRWKIAGIGDLDGDQVDDLVWRHADDGANVVWHSADSTRQQRLRAVTNTDWLIAGVADFDGDGMDDLLWRNPVTGANTIWRSGNAATADNITDIRNTAWGIVGVGDFDADGRGDVLWRNSGDGRNVIWRGGQYADQTPVRRVGDTDWQVAAIGDYDGDGRDDILWRHASTGRNVYWAGAQSDEQRRVRGVTNTDWQVVP